MVPVYVSIAGTVQPPASNCCWASAARPVTSVPLRIATSSRSSAGAVTGAAGAVSPGGGVTTSVGAGVFTSAAGSSELLGATSPPKSTSRPATTATVPSSATSEGHARSNRSRTVTGPAGYATARLPCERRSGSARTGQAGLVCERRRPAGGPRGRGGGSLAAGIRAAGAVPRTSRPRRGRHRHATGGSGDRDRSGSRPLRLAATPAVRGRTWLLLRGTPRREASGPPPGGRSGPDHDHGGRLRDQPAGPRPVPGRGVVHRGHRRATRRRGGDRNRPAYRNASAHHHDPRGREPFRRCDSTHHAADRRCSGHGGRVGRCPRRGSRIRGVHGGGGSRRPRRGGCVWVGS